jgi:hypothetical protein
MAGNSACGVVNVVAVYRLRLPLSSCQCCSLPGVGRLLRVDRISDGGPTKT